MGWRFWRRPPHPIDAAGLREAEGLARAGDLKAAAQAVQAYRAEKGDDPALRYLECRIWHDAGRADPAELLAHLRGAPREPASTRFPEARLLEVELLGALGRFDEAAAMLNALGREKLRGELGEHRAGLAAAIDASRGADGRSAPRREAEAMAAELARLDLVVRWRCSDLARLDALLDDKPELAANGCAGLAALVGEIAVRGAAASWRLALRAADRAILIGGSPWRPLTAVRERIDAGAPLYAALLRRIGAAFVPLPGVVGAEAHVEPGAHPAVVADHAARALAAAEARGVGVFRERPTPEGAVVIPVSYLGKGGEPRALYIETRPWEPDRLAEFKRWLGRLRASAAREAQVGLLSAHPPPQAVLDLVEGRSAAPPTPSLLQDAARHGARAATPRSLDEPKLGWLDQRAEVAERLVAAALGATLPSDLEMVRKVQATVLASLRTAGPLAPKQWNALYGYGALYGRILARSCGGRWSALGEDREPGDWEMHFPWGRTARPIGLLLELAAPGSEDDLLVRHFLEVKAEAEV